MASLFRLRRSRGPADLAIGMAGVRLGERVLQAGAADPRVFALIAGKAGLTGRACAVVDTPAAAQRVEAAAAREGVLVEVATVEDGPWPYDRASFDLGIVDGNVLLAADAASRHHRLQEMLRVVRAGGRVLVVYRAPLGLAGRLGFASSSPGASAHGATLVRAVEDAGFRPVRLLAEREGMTFVEGFRPAV
jgi:SAM-dependent methyltransferase